MKYQTIIGWLAECGEIHTPASFNKKYIKLNPTYLIDCDRRDTAGHLTEKGILHVWTALRHYGHRELADRVLEDVERGKRFAMGLR